MTTELPTPASRASAWPTQAARVQAYYCDDATLEEVRVTHPLAQVEVERIRGWISPEISASRDDDDPDLRPARPRPGATDHGGRQGHGDRCDGGGPGVRWRDARVVPARRVRDDRREILGQAPSLALHGALHCRAPAPRSSACCRRSRPTEKTSRTSYGFAPAPRWRSGV
jgi:hypothetical protein